MSGGAEVLSTFVPVVCKISINLGSANILLCPVPKQKHTICGSGGLTYLFNAKMLANHTRWRSMTPANFMIQCRTAFSAPSQSLNSIDNLGCEEYMEKPRYSSVGPHGTTWCGVVGNGRPDVRSDARVCRLFGVKRSLGRYSVSGAYLVGAWKRNCGRRGVPSASDFNLHTRCLRSDQVVSASLQFRTVIALT